MTNDQVDSRCQAVERYGGDRSLLGLSDDELDGALGLVCFEVGRPRPTVAGLVLLGREAALRRHGLDRNLAKC